MFCCKTSKNGHCTSQGGGKAHKVITFAASKSVVFFLSVARLNFYFSSKKVFTAVGATIQLNSGIYLLPQHCSKLYLLASKSAFFISCKIISLISQPNFWLRKSLVRFPKACLLPHLPVSPLSILGLCLLCLLRVFMLNLSILFF